MCNCGRRGRDYWEQGCPECGHVYNFAVNNSTPVSSFKHQAAEIRQRLLDHVNPPKTQRKPTKKFLT